jgi:hypothetical protein
MFRFCLFDSNPPDVSFTLLTHEGGNDELPFNKIKSVLPDSNITGMNREEEEPILYPMTFSPGWYLQPELKGLIFRLESSTGTKMYFQPPLLFARANDL